MPPEVKEPSVDASATKTPIVQIYIDFDGTLTGKNARKTSFSNFYQSLEEQQIINEEEQILAALKTKFDAHNNADLLINPDAVNFLKTLLKKSDDVRINVITYNSVSYARALFKYQGFSKKEVGRLNIQRCEKSKLEFVGDDIGAQVNKAAHVYIFDHDDAYCKYMAEAAVRAGYSESQIDAVTATTSKFRWNKHLAEIEAIVQPNSQALQISYLQPAIATPQITSAELAAEIRARLLIHANKNRINCLVKECFHLIPQFYSRLLANKEDAAQILEIICNRQAVINKIISDVLKTFNVGINAAVIRNMLFTSMTNIMTQYRNFFENFNAYLNDRNINVDIFNQDLPTLNIDQCETQLELVTQHDELGLIALTDEEITKAQNLDLHNSGYVVHKIVVSTVVENKRQEKSVFFSLIDDDPNQILVITTPLTNSEYIDALLEIKTMLNLKPHVFPNKFHIIAPIVIKINSADVINTSVKYAGDLNWNGQLFPPKLAVDYRFSAYHHISRFKEFVKYIKCKMPFVPPASVPYTLNLLNKLGIVIKNNYADFMLHAWRATYLPQMTDEQCVQASKVEYLLGFKTNERGFDLALLDYIVCCKWMTAVKNIFKLVELFLKIIAESFRYLEHQLYVTTPIDCVLQMLRYIGLKLCKFFHVVFEGAWLLTRAFISPLTSFKAGWAISGWHAALSVICSAATMCAFGVFALPAIAAFAAKLGMTAFFTLPNPIAWVLSKLGISLTPQLQTLSSLFTLGLGAAVINQVREELPRRFAAKPNPVAQDEKVKLPADPLPLATEVIELIASKLAFFQVAPADEKNAALTPLRAHDSTLTT